MILDRNGEPLTQNDTAYTVYARSNAVKDKAYAAKMLAASLAMDESKIYERLISVKASEITLAKQIEKEKITKLTQTPLDGVYYARDNLRSYPKGDLLCQVLGFTASDGVGVSGIEKYYDKYNYKYGVGVYTPASGSCVIF